MQPSAVQGEVGLTPVAAPRSLTCGEVFGGNEPIHTAIELPGLHAVLYSHPSDGARGGDVHYLSVCGSGLLARVCIADVLGHGEVVAQVSAQMHAHLRRSVDVIDERRVFKAMDRRLEEIGIRAMTTAALLTYYAPTRRLTVSYAGHPPGWIYSASQRQWTRWEIDARGDHGVADLPLGTGLESTYGRRRQRATVGDRLLIVTDGVLDAPDARGDEFGASGVERVLNATPQQTPEGLVKSLLDALSQHTRRDRPAHDDVTIFVGELVRAAAGPALWHMIKNRLLTRTERP